MSKQIYILTYSFFFLQDGPVHYLYTLSGYLKIFDTHISLFTKGVLYPYLFEGYSLGSLGLGFHFPTQDHKFR